ncbi:hypothetical protein P154DRAFT_315172 [Amniculicola lignicola CBS 123094]|uniref:Uncharacterized protein n=1 Tax=Amniculicola lignicola CBS 123094 TaxID=1392246 RepID=A0A6A5WUX9_9PLEO|nr:hypothetical protein P154DRAFT_315172 [Amniculicola lignicola CBS 123094]
MGVCHGCPFLLLAGAQCLQRHRRAHVGRVALAHAGVDESERTLQISPHEQAGVRVLAQRYVCMSVCMYACMYGGMYVNVGAVKYVSKCNACPCCSAVQRTWRQAGALVCCPGVSCNSASDLVRRITSTGLGICLQRDCWARLDERLEQLQAVAVCCPVLLVVAARAVRAVFPRRALAATILFAEDVRFRGDRWSELEHSRFSTILSPVAPWGQSESWPANRLHAF